jgi:hypothetical protein
MKTEDLGSWLGRMMTSVGRERVIGEEADVY